MRERGGHGIEGEKKGEKLNFDVCLTGFTFIKVTTSVTHVFIYSLVSYPNFVRGPLLDDVRPFFGPREVLGTHH